MKEKAIKVLALGVVLMFVLMAFSIVPANFGAESKETSKSTPELWADIAMVSAEPLAFESTTEDLDPLPNVVPFWVDLVDAEDKDLSNDGEGVYIAVLDTGLFGLWKQFGIPEDNIATGLGKGFTHDIKWVGDENDGYFEWSELRDDRGFITRQWGSGHGTHVTSTIVGFDLIPWGGSPLYHVEGVAPKATIIPVLVLDYWLVSCPKVDYPGCHGGQVLFTGGTKEMLAAGINYVTDLATNELAGKSVIISMSLGADTPPTTDLVKNAIDNAIDNGVIVVASAGNNGYDGMTWPAAFPQVISTAAGGWTEQYCPVTYDDGDVVSVNNGFWRTGVRDVPEKLKTEDFHGNKMQIFLKDFSSRPNKDLGQKDWYLDLTAPGVRIAGPYKGYAYWTGSKWAYPFPGYSLVSGTSMAAPHVSAIIALILEEYEKDKEEKKCSKSFKTFEKNKQARMELILKVAAESSLPYNEAKVVDYVGGGKYEVQYNSWERRDWGYGFLQADRALFMYESHT